MSQSAPAHSTTYYSTRIILVGTNGCGKTTTLKNILKATNRKCLVITPYDNEWIEFPATRLQSPMDFVYTGIRRHIFEPKRTMGLLRYFKNGIIVFDDCRAYVHPNVQQAIHSLLMGSRQRQIDVYAAAHGMTEIPPVFYTFVTDFVLFQTRDNPKRNRLAVMRDPDRLLKKIAEVNAIATGQKPHPKDWKGVNEDGKPCAGKKIHDRYYCETIKNE